MSQFSHIIKKGLLLCILAILFLPLIQSTFTLREFHPLKGDVTLPADIEFNKQGWFSGNFQQKKEEYLNAMFGFRTLFVKAHNQIAYSLFGKVNAQGVIIGKQNYLYEESYINAYTGRDFLGEDSISHTINRLKFISDTLNKLGKQLIVVFAAGKASFYPEFIPDSYFPIKEKTNYKLLSSEAYKAGLNMIDFNKWFMDNKHKSKYPLYPQHGVHWSTYGTALAADSLIRMMESLRHIDIPNLRITSIKMEQPHDVDYDIADGMNLLFKFKSFDVAYPQMKVDDTTGKTKPKVLVISDSFYWGMYNLGIANCFQNDHFWYYNKQVYPESFKQELFADQLNIGDEIQKHDVIVIMATEATLRKISWGFIEEAEKFYKGIKTSPERDTEYYKKIKEIIASIKTNPQWLEDSGTRAQEKGISLDSSLVLEAMWQIESAKK